MFFEAPLHDQEKLQATPQSLITLPMDQPTRRAAVVAEQRQAPLQRFLANLDCAASE